MVTRSRCILRCSACGLSLLVEDFDAPAVPGVVKVLTGLLIMGRSSRGVVPMDPEVAGYHGCVRAGVRIEWEPLDRPDPGAEPARAHRPTPAPSGFPQAPDPPRCRSTALPRERPLDRADVPYRPPSRGGAR